MKVIPVLDLLNGIVVQARGGLRNQYEPLKSILTSSHQPVKVASAIKTTFDCEEMYVADLDAITGRGGNLEVLREIIRSIQAKLLVDAGVSDAAGADRLVEVGINRIVVGTETLQSIEDLSQIIGRSSIAETIVSIDYMNGRILSKCKWIIHAGVEKAAKKFEALDASRLIVLDLSRVGSLSGVNLDLVKTILHSVSIPVLVGGGVRNLEDLFMLKRIGVAGALVSTALHNGSITKDDILQLSA